MSTAYHPKSDGQNEVLNRGLETYFRCLTSEELAQELQTRDELLKQLAYNLSWAQQRMIRASNQHQREVHYNVGDSVFFFKLRPHRQSSLNGPINKKLAAWYFDPFRIMYYFSSRTCSLSFAIATRI